MSADVATRSTRQRRVGQPLASFLITALPVVLLVVLAVLGGKVPALVVDLGALVLVALLLLPMRSGFGQLLWFGRAELDIDDDGVHLGTRGRRSRSQSVSVAPQLGYRAPWSAISEVRLISGSAATRSMSRSAVGQRRGLPQPSTYHGYFPVRGRRRHLAMTVDLAQVELPRVQTSRRTSSPGSPMMKSHTWVLPVRDVDAARAALAAHGVTPLDTDEPATPLPDVDEVARLARRLMEP